MSTLASRSSSNQWLYSEMGKSWWNQGFKVLVRANTIYQIGCGFKYRRRFEPTAPTIYSIWILILIYGKTFRFRISVLRCAFVRRKQILCENKRSYSIQPSPSIRLLPREQFSKAKQALTTSKAKEIASFFINFQTWLNKQFVDI